MSQTGSTVLNPKYWMNIIYSGKTNLEVKHFVKNLFKQTITCKHCLTPDKSWQACLCLEANHGIASLRNEWFNESLCLGLTNVFFKFSNFRVLIWKMRPVRNWFVSMWGAKNFSVCETILWHFQTLVWDYWWMKFWGKNSYKFIFSFPGKMYRENRNCETLWQIFRRRSSRILFWSVRFSPTCIAELTV